MASSLQVVDASTVVDGTGLKSAASLPPSDDKTYEIGPGCLLTTVYLRNTGKLGQLPSPRRGSGGGGKGRRQSHASTAEEREGDDDDDQEEEEDAEEAHDDEEAAALRALGLPVSFGTSKSYKGRRASRAISPSLSPSPSPSPSPSASPARGVVSSSSPSRINNKDNYKVGLCLFYQRPQGCSKGDSCTFAHGRADRKRAQRAKRAQAEQQAAKTPPSPLLSPPPPQQQQQHKTYTTVRRPRGADPLAYRPPYHGPPYLEAKLGKYFTKRAWLWSHEIYDRGVKMDDDMWFSVTPFHLARHHASRLLALESSVSSSSSAVENGSCGSGSGSGSSSGCAGRRGPGRLVLDGFAGVGGNAAALAFAGARVVAVDLSLPRLEAARSNAELFFLGDGPSSGCADAFGEKQKEGEEEEEELQQQKQKQKQKQQRRGGLFDVVAGDFFSVAPRLRVDCVFMSPPWGGPGYLGSDKNEEKVGAKKEERSQQFFRVRDDVGGLGVGGISALLAAAASAHAPAAPLDIAVFLPRSTFLPDLVEAATRLGTCLEVERSVGRGSDKAIGVTAYFGASARRKNC